MAENTRKMIFFGALVIFALLMVLNPFAAISKLGGPPRTKLDDSRIAGFSQIIAQASGKAIDVSLELMRNKRLVFIGEYGFLSEEIVFAGELIRHSGELGVTAAGLEHLLWEDQSRIDRFMNAPEFSETEARNLLLRRAPIYGFTEYVALLKTLWETGKVCASKGQKFRLYGLSYIQDYSVITSQEDANNPEVIKGILKRGTPDSFMSTLITTILSDTAEKMIVFSHRRFSLKTAREITYTQGLEKMGFAETRHAAAIAMEKLGAQNVGTIIFHDPWPDSQSNVEGLCWPVNGQIDQILQRQDKADVPELPFAFNTRSSLGELLLEHGDYRIDPSTRAKLSDLCDVYVVLAPLPLLHAASPIADFINTENASQALEHLPKIADSSSLTPEGINSMIKSNAERLQQDLANFH